MMKEKKMICIGDSLTYGLGVPVEDNWVELLNKRSFRQVINRGISGDTSGGMLARFHREVLAEMPDTVLIMGGSNDLIMGCDISVVKSNLMAMVHQAYAAKINVIACAEISGDTAHIRPDWKQISDFCEVDQKLFQMSIWMEEFCRVFQVPFINLYDRFKKRTQGRIQDYFFDGVHPNRQGHRLIADIIADEQRMVLDERMIRK
ncbi:Arylesterase precursor [uncultured Roseburia sp.]|uniref:GDSL-type esterase/lipase family protein n=1 Tax=Brotonthovivens ammoniilytica TaxID=2981725 RepID=A0ABT2THA8_9FIRM|nr:GDSL-type esterase/lipase family protein [Brotonthovivens ammoniilytica]MCU6761072.1 GDSL-type esterase/lipase family protein [Brotonthovivens ammoniilytica]SCI18073.1 Arylesterase precursor [uncultured Roseburia sp.]